MTNKVAVYFLFFNLVHSVFCIANGADEKSRRLCVLILSRIPSRRAPPEHLPPIEGDANFVRLAIRDALEMTGRGSNLQNRRADLLRTRFLEVQFFTPKDWFYAEHYLRDGSIVFAGPNDFILLEAKTGKIFKGDVYDDWRESAYDRSRAIKMNYARSLKEIKLDK